MFERFLNRNAVAVREPEKAERLEIFVGATYPSMRVLAMDKAVDPPDLFIREGDVRITKYSSFDPRWQTDFEDASPEAPWLVAIGAGVREGAHLERCLAREEVRK